MVLWEIVLEFVWLLLFGIDSKYVYVAQMKVLKNESKSEEDQVNILNIHFHFVFTRNGCMLKVSEINFLQKIFQVH